MKSWAKVSVGLAVFAFINLVMFIALSNPFETVLGYLEDQADIYDANDGSSTVGDDIAGHYSMLRTVFGLTFVLSMVGLGVWFFLGAHEDEYQQY